MSKIILEKVISEKGLVIEKEDLSQLGSDLKNSTVKVEITLEKESQSDADIIPYGKQWITNKDVQIVTNTLQSDYLTQGPKVKEFEDALCAYTGAKHALAVANGTAALHIAVNSLNLKEGFQGITTPNTFVASANSILYNKGQVKFADILPDVHNIDPENIKKIITPKTKVMVPVDFAGHPCDMEKLSQIAKKQNLKIIRDACHSIGSVYKGEKTGNNTFSDMTIFSFHPVKHITTGEGGAILTNNDEIYQNLILLRSHGITKENALMTKNEGPWYYEMQTLGFNYRITDLQCALGLSQLEKLDAFVTRRREIVEMYNEAFRNIPEITTPVEKKDVKSSYHLYVVEIDFKKIKITRREFMMDLKAKKILTQVHYIPVHLQPYYKKEFGYKAGDFPVAENYYDKALSLPMYPKMTDNDVKRVITAVKELL